jgi:site-specific DNA recombinase
MLQDAKNKLFDVLLVYKLDRLGRAARIVLNAVYELEQCGVKIKSMTEPFDTGDASGRFLLTILAGVADLERSNILDRMWHGANRAARAGKWLGGIVPFGYTLEEGCLAISETTIPGLEMSESDVVRMIYRLMVEQKMSTIKIASYLNALGVPPAYALAGRQVSRGKRKEKTAGVWNPGRIRNMLVNTTYMGVHHYGKRSKKEREVIAREVPAIVPEDLWEQAQQVLHENQIEATRNARRQYLLRGLVKCGICGLTYSGTAYKGPAGKPKAYYSCNGKVPHKGPYNGRCGSKNVPQAWIEGLVWNDCMRFIMEPGAALADLDESMKETKEKASSVESELQLVSRSIIDKETEKQSILDLYRKSLITIKDVESQLQKISAEKGSLESRLHDLTEQASSSSSLAQQYAGAAEMLASLREQVGAGEPPYELKRQIVKTLVDKIVVETKNEGRRPRAAVSISYCFSKDIHRTDKDS